MLSKEFITENKKENCFHIRHNKRFYGRYSTYQEAYTEYCNFIQKYTYEMISTQTGLTIPTLTKRVFNLKIKGSVLGTKVVFTVDQIQQLIDYNPHEYHQGICKKYDKRKLAIVESYIKRQNLREVSRVLNIPLNAVKSAVKEYKETGFCIVESKINKNESKDIK